MHQQILNKRNGYRLVGGVVLAGCFALLGLLPAEAATAANIAAMKSQLETAQAQLLKIAPSGQVLGVSSTAEAPTRPVCRLTFDKSIYKVGDTIKMSWTTTGAKEAQFITDTSGKDTLALPTGTTLALRGSAEVKASVTGSPSVFMKVTSVSGQESTCGRSITVVDEAAGKKDARIAALQTKLVNLVAQANKLEEQLAALNERVAANLIAQLQTQIQIEQLMNATTTPKTGGKAFVDPGSFESSTVTSGENDTLVTYTMEFEVVADNTVVYIPKTAARSGTAGVLFRVMGATGATSSAARGTISATLTSTADEESGYYEVNEGETETFTATIAFDPTVTGPYRAELLRLNWTDTLTVEVDGSITPGKLKPLKFMPAEDFRSDYVAVNAS
jgi:hypothetical protein